MALVWKFSAKVSMNTSPVGLVGNMVVRGNIRSGLTTCYRLLTAAAQPLGTFVALCWDFGPDVYRVGGYQPPHPGCRKLVADETGQTTRLSLYRISGGLTEFLFLPHRLNGLQSAPPPCPRGQQYPGFLLQPLALVSSRRDSRDVPEDCRFGPPGGNDCFHETQLLRWKVGLSVLVFEGGTGCHIY